MYYQNSLPGPDWLLLVELFILSGGLLDLLRLFSLFGGILILDLFNLGITLFNFFLILDLLLSLLGDYELDWVRDELGLHNVSSSCRVPCGNTRVS